LLVPSENETTVRQQRRLNEGRYSEKNNNATDRGAVSRLPPEAVKYPSYGGPIRTSPQMSQINPGRPKRNSNAQSPVRIGRLSLLCREAALISTRLQPGGEWLVPENGFNRFLGARAFGKPLKRLRHRVW